MKVWTYKGTRGPKEIGIVVKEGKYYYKFCYSYLRYRFSSIKNKRQKLKVEIIKTESSIFNYFPSELCKPRHYLEADTIYIHEIFRLLKKLK
jgi:hypothetical protein